MSRSSLQRVGDRDGSTRHRVAVSVATPFRALDVLSMDCSRRCVFFGVYFPLQMKLIDPTGHGVAPVLAFAQHAGGRDRKRNFL